MKKIGFFVLFHCLVLSEISIATPVPKSNDEKNEAATNLRKFAYNLLDIKTLEQYGGAKGVAASSPFGVGYMLANINTKIWNISTAGFDGLLVTPSEKISEQYATLLEKLNQGGFSTKNLLYVRNENGSVNMPIDAARELKTELIHSNYVSDWNNACDLMNGIIANQSGGKLDDQLLGTGGYYGDSFYYFTAGAYINTIHKKAAWHKSWTSVGEKKFSDGLSLPYYQVEGKYTTLENEKSSVVLVPIRIENKDMSAIFVLPKGDLTQITKKDLVSFFKVDSALKAQWKNTNKRVELPAFNITLLNQHLRRLEQLGVNDTFCLPGEQALANAADQERAQEKYAAKRPYFAHPIAQATHIEISPDFVEVASATGMSVTSVKKLFKGPDRTQSSGASLTKPDGRVNSSNAPVKGGSRQKRTVKGGKASSTPATTTTEKAIQDKENVLVFNKPFIWLIHDSELGVLFYGSVNSMKRYKKDLDQDEFELLHETEKSATWGCP